MIKAKYNVDIIAWCTDDGPDGKKMRCLLQAQFPWLIALLCWAHQINLVVGDFLGVRRSTIECVNSALEVIKWFNNHGTALELLRDEQKLSFAGNCWALILPAYTRWTAHCQAVTRLLKIEVPICLCWTRNEQRLLLCAGNRAEQKQKAGEIRDIVRDVTFWASLKQYVFCTTCFVFITYLVPGSRRFLNL